MVSDAVAVQDVGADVVFLGAPGSVRRHYGFVSFSVYCNFFLYCIVSYYVELCCKVLWQTVSSGGYMSRAALFGVVTAYGMHAVLVFCDRYKVCTSWRLYYSMV